MKAVTASRVERPADEALAEQVAAELGWPRVARNQRTVAALLAEEQLQEVVVAADGRLTWRNRAGGAFSFHPNMAVQRLRVLADGGGDVLMAAAGLRAGDRVLDATLGLGADAIVASQVVGESGTVLGLERAPVIAALVRHGLATYEHKFAAPMRRVQVVCADHHQWLAEHAEPWDVIWFDPMFQVPRRASHGLAGLRWLADERQPALATIRLAQRRARRMVLYKTAPGEHYPEEFQPDDWVGARGAAVRYAVFGPLAGAEGEA